MKVIFRRYVPVLAAIALQAIAQKVLDQVSQYLKNNQVNDNQEEGT